MRWMDIRDEANMCFSHVANLNVLYWQLPRSQHECRVSYSQVDRYAGRMWNDPCI